MLFTVTFNKGNKKLCDA